MSKTKIIVVAGPTASGKTNLAVEIAKAVSGEVISADSMQVYKGMSIASAAPAQKEMQGVAHHLVEFLDQSEGFSVSDFCRLAKEKISEISARGNVPVIAGGTGLFIDSLVDNINFTEAQTDFELRERLMQKDCDELYSMLLEVDKEAAEKIHKNNKKRVARALEIYYSSGSTKTAQDINSKKEESPYEALYFVIGFKSREVLYERINRRVDLMVEAGLVDEARENLSKEKATSAQAIGHKELAPYFSGEKSLEQALDDLKRETRRYAKRQITWFKRRENAVWLYADEEGADIVKAAVDKSREFLNG
ncbi:MAG: tRNA (adenosine(37)-N6)-dimethylallyltransferase MiaA [Eubacterium sp.]